MIENMKEDEINKLAEDIYRSRVFTSLQCPPTMIPTVFIPLFFVKEEQILELIKDAPGMIYEYLYKAGPRMINGYPTFFSFKIASEDDTKKIISKVEEIKKAVQGVT